MLIQVLENPMLGKEDFTWIYMDEYEERNVHVEVQVKLARYSSETFDITVDVSRSAVTPILGEANADKFFEQQRAARFCVAPGCLLEAIATLLNGKSLDDTKTLSNKELALIESLHVKPKAETGNAQDVDEDESENDEEETK